MFIMLFSRKLIPLHRSWSGADADATATREIHDSYLFEIGGESTYLNRNKYRVVITKCWVRVLVESFKQTNRTQRLNTLENENLHTIANNCLDKKIMEAEGTQLGARMYWLLLRKWSLLLYCCNKIALFSFVCSWILYKMSFVCSIFSAHSRRDFFCQKFLMLFDNMLHE